VGFATTVPCKNILGWISPGLAEIAASVQSLEIGNTTLRSILRFVVAL